MDRAAPPAPTPQVPPYAPTPDSYPPGPQVPEQVYPPAELAAAVAGVKDDARRGLLGRLVDRFVPEKARKVLHDMGAKRTFEVLTGAYKSAEGAKAKVELTRQILGNAGGKVGKSLLISLAANFVVAGSGRIINGIRAAGRAWLDPEHKNDTSYRLWKVGITAGMVAVFGVTATTIFTHGSEILEGIGSAVKHTAEGAGHLASEVAHGLGFGGTDAVPDAVNPPDGAHSLVEHVASSHTVEHPISSIGDVSGDNTAYSFAHGIGSSDPSTPPSDGDFTTRPGVENPIPVPPATDDPTDYSGSSGDIAQGNANATAAASEIAEKAAAAEHSDIDKVNLAHDEGGVYLWEIAKDNGFTPEELAKMRPQLQDLNDKGFLDVKFGGSGDSWYLIGNPGVAQEGGLYYATFDEQGNVTGWGHFDQGHELTKSEQVLVLQTLNQGGQVMTAEQFAHVMQAGGETETPSFDSVATVLALEKQFDEMLFHIQVEAHVPGVDGNEVVGKNLEAFISDPEHAKMIASLSEDQRHALFSYIDGKVDAAVGDAGGYDPESTNIQSYDAMWDKVHPDTDVVAPIPGTEGGDTDYTALDDPITRGTEHANAAVEEIRQKAVEYWSEENHQYDVDKVNLAHEEGGIYLSDIAKANGFTDAEIASLRPQLEDLRDKGLIDIEFGGSGQSWFVDGNPSAPQPIIVVTEFNADGSPKTWDTFVGELPKDKQVLLLQDLNHNGKIMTPEELADSLPADTGTGTGTDMPVTLPNGQTFEIPEIPIPGSDQTPTDPSIPGTEGEASPSTPSGTEFGNRPAPTDTVPGPETGTVVGQLAEAARGYVGSLSAAAQDALWSDLRDGALSPASAQAVLGYLQEHNPRLVGEILAQNLSGGAPVNILGMLQGALQQGAAAADDAFAGAADAVSAAVALIGDFPEFIAGRGLEGVLSPEQMDNIISDYLAERPSFGAMTDAAQSAVREQLRNILSERAGALAGA